MTSSGLKKLKLKCTEGPGSLRKSAKTECCNELYEGKGAKGLRIYFKRVAGRNGWMKPKSGRNGSNQCGGFLVGGRLEKGNGIGIAANTL